MIQSIMVNYKLNDDIHNPRYISDGMNELERNMKRILDFVVALVCLVIFSPLFLVCYIAVKREDGGPAIFKQERIGRFGRPFYIYNTLYHLQFFGHSPKLICIMDLKGG